MARFGTLYTYLPNARILKIVGAAHLNGLELEIPEDFAFGQANTTLEFLAKWPVGKVPAFETPDGVYLAESSAIAHYVAQSGPRSGALLGSTAVESAKIQQWIQVADFEVFPNVIDLVSPYVGKAPFDAAVEAKARENLDRALNALEAHVAKRDGSYIATEQLSLADLAIASALYWGFMLVIDEEWRARAPRVVQWYLRTIQADGLVKVFGEPQMIPKRVQLS